MDVSRIKIAEPASASSLPRLSLSQGQIISAQIIKSEGSQIMLQYGNYLFKAQTELTLKPGERLKLIVESIDNNMISLKIISGTEAKPPQTITALSSPMQKNDSDLEMIARQLTKFNLPVSLALLTDINKLIKRNKLSVETGRLLVWLKSAGIEVDSEQDIKALQVLQKFFRGELNNQQESKCFDFLNAAENQFIGGLNIYGWPLGRHHIYLVQESSKSEVLLTDRCQLAIRVDSSSLRELWFFIDIAERHMKASIYCTNEEFKIILEKEIPNFKSALEAAGYQVRNVTVEVNKGKSTIFDLLPEKEINNINIKV